MTIKFSKVVSSGPGGITVQADDGKQYTLKGTVAWRGNNPGNIRPGNPTVDAMAVGTQNAGTNGKFLVFPDRATGDAAREHVLFSTYGNSTLSNAITAYAPPSDNNNTAAYIAALAEGAGVNPDTKMKDMTPSQRAAIMTAQVGEENVTPGKISAADGTEVPSEVQQQFGASPVKGGPAAPTPMPGRPAALSDTQDIRNTAEVGFRAPDAGTSAALNAELRATGPGATLTPLEQGNLLDYGAPIDEKTQGALAPTSGAFAGVVVRAKAIAGPAAPVPMPGRPSELNVPQAGAPTPMPGRPNALNGAAPAGAPETAIAASGKAVPTGIQVMPNGTSVSVTRGPDGRAVITPVRALTDVPGLGDLAAPGTVASGPVGKAIGDAATAAGTQVQSLLHNAGQSASGTIKGVVGGLEGLGQGALNMLAPIGAAAGDIGNELKDSAINNAVAKTVQEAIPAVQGAGANLISGAEGLGQSLLHMLPGQGPEARPSVSAGSQTSPIVTKLPAPKASLPTSAGAGAADLPSVTPWGWGGLPGGTPGSLAASGVGGNAGALTASGSANLLGGGMTPTPGAQSVGAIAGLGALAGAVGGAPALPAGASGAPLIPGPGTSPTPASSPQSWATQYAPLVQQLIGIQSGKTVPVGTQGTAQGGAYGYQVQPDGSILNTTTGRTTSPATSPAAGAPAPQVTDPGVWGNPQAEQAANNNNPGTYWDSSQGGWVGGGQGGGQGGSSGWGSH